MCARQAESQTGAPVPMAARLASGQISLIAFARKAGKNIFSVIPEATLHQTYLRGPANIHYVCDPDTIMELLVGKGRHFPKSQFTRNVIGAAVGKGMILAEGEEWKEQRRRYAPLFAARNLPVLSAHFGETGQDMARAMAARPGEIDVADAAQEATLTNISRVMFSGTETVDKRDVRNALREFTDFISYMSLFDLMGLPKWVPRLKWLKGKAPVRNVRALGRNVIESRRAKRHAEPEDFLDLMIEALEEDREELDTTVDNLLTFVAAGYETSANTLAWGLYLLALYPAVQDDLRREVTAACPDGPVRFETLAAMPRVQAHVRETLRLYPAGALFARDATEDTTIGAVTFRRGDVIMFPVYALHRNTRLWEAPECYRADRFIGTTFPRGQFIPFGDGPRICIGAQYAETEIMVLMASLLRELEFRPSAHPVPEPVLTFTMRPGGPMILTAAPLKAPARQASSAA